MCSLPLASVEALWLRGVQFGDKSPSGNVTLTRFAHQVSKFCLPTLRAPVCEQTRKTLPAAKAAGSIPQMSTKKDTQLSVFFYGDSWENLLRPARLPTRKRRSNAPNSAPTRLALGAECDSAHEPQRQKNTTQIGWCVVVTHSQAKSNP